MSTSIRRRIRSDVEIEDYSQLEPSEIAAAARGRAEVLVVFVNSMPLSGAVRGARVGLEVLAVAPKVAILVGARPNVSWDQRCEQAGLTWRYGGRALDPSDHGSVVMDRIPVSCQASVPVSEPVPSVGPLSDGGKPYWGENSFVGLGTVVPEEIPAQQAVSRYIDEAMRGLKALPFRSGMAGIVPDSPLQLKLNSGMIHGAVLLGLGSQERRILESSDIAVLLGYPDLAQAPESLTWPLVSRLPGIELLIALIHDAVEAVEASVQDRDDQGDPGF